jgi:hypothetical protein
MDISYWIQSNPKITVGHTVKKYYGKYLYKMVLYAPAGRLILTNGDIAQELDFRKNYNPGGSWWYRRNHQSSVTSADVTLLEQLRNLKQANIPGIKMRVEEPRIQVYAQTDDDMRNIVETYIPSYKSYVESVYGPEDEEAEAILNSGAIIRKNDLGYRYKVIIKDGTFPAHVKESLYLYLSNIGPELVHVPKGTMDMLVKNSAYIWNCYFYSNDEGINTIVRLMAPDLISNCHELVVMPHK